MIKPLKRRQLLYEVAQDAIKDYIIAEKLKPGSPLPPEAELAQQFGVSRSSLREAVKALEALGILESRAGAGLFVSPFSFKPLLANLAYGLMFDPKALSDIIEVRTHLEYSMSERAVAAATAEQVARLRTMLEEMHTQALEGRYSSQADRQFHHILWENVDNLMLGQILDIFWLVHEEARERDTISDPPDPLMTYRRHVDIVDALEAASIERLKDALTHHDAAMLERLARQSPTPPAPSL